MDNEPMDADMSDEDIDYDEEWLYCLRANELDDAVKLLKQRLVTNIHVVDNNGNGPLHYCCANNLAEAVVFLLTECKMGYCRPNHSGNTPLQWAVQTNSADAVKQLLLHDYRVHRADYEKLERSDFFENVESVVLSDAHRLDDDTKRHYNITEYPSNYAANNWVGIVTPNSFGKSILNDAFSAKDQTILHAILEHPASAVLDKPTETSQTDLPIERVSVGGVNGVVHAFQFGGRIADNRPPVVRARELEIKQDEILNAQSAEMDHTGEVIWETDLVAAQWLTALARDGKFEGKRVLQLGSGCGLSAIAMYVSAAFYQKAPHTLVFTDVCSDTVRNLKFNVELNKLGADDRVRIHYLDWTKPDTWPRDEQGSLQTFDIVIGSDLVYDANLVEPLTNVIQATLSKAHGEVFYAFKQARDGARLIPEALTKLGFNVTTQPSPREFQSNPLESSNDKVLEAFFPDLQDDDYTLLYATRGNACTSDAAVHNDPVYRN
ncbi:methyltransferase, putative [Babesia bigemina]|uniref:Methyltransferase, putative n=1 Tax=Babesia bigemina TaxID=5866 RepID=A0A061D7S4_BABBI|nr:methyltransferase, putative [Babesia bigemina]CDR93765.1 methyltransferase, putative [Babesia bigemina]|eukprot:XP_012765951.1 methyltransferase, putative [Babesia bigemina]